MTVPLFTSVLLSAIGYKSFVWINFISFVFSAIFFGSLLVLFRKSQDEDMVESHPTIASDSSSTALTSSPPSSFTWRGCHRTLSSYFFESCNKKRHRVLDDEGDDRPPASMFVNNEDEEGKGTSAYS